jgi:hypothetical protein
MSRIAAPLVAIAVLAAGSSAVSPAATGDQCTSVYLYRPVETPLKVSSDLTVRLRNPYGQRVNIGRYFVQFRIVYASPADRAKVSSVQWGLDGGAPRYKRDGGRDGYLIGSFHFTPGPHVITAKITPSGGPAVVGEFRFTATGCAPMSFSAAADNRKTPGAQPTAFALHSGSAPLRRVQLGARSALVSTAARLRGRKVGELRFVTGTTVHVETLRLPRRWSDPHAISLLRAGRLRVVLDPSAHRFLEVSGLPDTVTDLHLSFGGPRQIGQLPLETSTGTPAGAAGLIGTRARCQGTTWEAWATGATGPTVHATSRQGGRAFHACQRR